MRQLFQKFRICFNLTAERSRQHLSEKCSVEAIEGDLNTIDLQGSRFDVIICVAALHHVVELEHVIDTIAGALEPNGEFWSIGEYIGRNGIRLWPEDYEAANTFFTQLSERHRTYTLPGFEPRVDKYLPNFDHSVDLFEGIRSEEIYFTLHQKLFPLHADRRDCVLSRLIDPGYSSNYDLGNPDDVTIIEQ